MSLIPVAAFLAGSLLSILLPIGLLISLWVWFFMFLRRVPDTPDPAEHRPAPRQVAASPSTPGDIAPPPNQQ
ncbi:MAG: hypothetical protein ACRDLP_03835 [Solirubrobacteraceae bacterium]